MCGLEETLDGFVHRSGWIIDTPGGRGTDEKVATVKLCETLVAQTETVTEITVICGQSQEVSRM